MTVQVNVNMLNPVQLRFRDDADIALYGEDWYLYDESAIVRLPAHRLVELEQTSGYPVRTMMAELRRHSVLGDLLVAWTAVWLVKPELAGDFDAFTPLTFAIEWRAAKMDDLGKDDVSSPDTSPTDPTPTVALVTMPAAG